MDKIAKALRENLNENYRIDVDSLSSIYCHYTCPEKGKSKIISQVEPRENGYKAFFSDGETETYSKDDIDEMIDDLTEDAEKVGIWI